MLAFLPLVPAPPARGPRPGRVGRAGWAGPARALVVGLEPVDVDRWAALWRVSVLGPARAAARNEAHPPWMELADLRVGGGVEQLLGPQHHLVALD
jgi:hypothetical protein